VVTESFRSVRTKVTQTWKQGPRNGVGLPFPIAELRSVTCHMGSHMQVYQNGPQFSDEFKTAVFHIRVGRCGFGRFLSFPLPDTRPEFLLSTARLHYIHTFQCPTFCCWLMILSDKKRELAVRGVSHEDQFCFTSHANVNVVRFISAHGMHVNFDSLYNHGQLIGQSVQDFQSGLSNTDYW